MNLLFIHPLFVDKQDKKVQNAVVVANYNGVRITVFKPAN